MLTDLYGYQGFIGLFCVSELEGPLQVLYHNGDILLYMLKLGSRNLADVRGWN